MKYVAVIGSRKFPDEEKVRDYVSKLWSYWGGDSLELAHEFALVSGGAVGVDTWAEQEWLSKGGRVLSLRPREIGPENFRIEAWQLGGEQPNLTVLQDPHPSFADYKSALWYRDTLIAEAAEGVIAFWDGLSNGTRWTCGYARDIGKPVEVIHP